MIKTSFPVKYLKSIVVFVVACNKHLSVGEFHAL